MFVVCSFFVYGSLFLVLCLIAVVRCCCLLFLFEFCRRCWLLLSVFAVLCCLFDIIAVRWCCLPFFGCLLLCVAACWCFRCIIVVCLSVAVVYCLCVVVACCCLFVVV